MAPCALPVPPPDDLLVDVPEEPVGGYQADKGFEVILCPVPYIGYSKLCHFACRGSNLLVQSDLGSRGSQIA